MKRMGFHQKSQQWVVKRGKDVRSDGKPYPHVFYLGKDKDDALRKLGLIEAKQLELKQKGISHWTEEALHQLQEQGATRLAKRKLLGTDVPKVSVNELVKTPAASELLDAEGNIKPQCWEQVHHLIITELMRHPYNQQKFADALQEAYFKDPIGTIERMKRLAAVPGGPNIHLNVGRGGGVGLNVFVQDDTIDATTKALGGLTGGDKADTKDSSA